MVLIQIIGKAPHPQFIRELTAFFAPLESCRILSLEQPEVPDSTPANIICLFRDCCHPEPEAIRKLSRENAVAIVSAENTDILRQLSAVGIDTIPCGLSAHDTFTLASFTEESTVISLQRSITTLDGETVEPMDFPVNSAFAHSLSRFLLMAFCAVCCLTGHAAGLTRFLAEEKEDMV